MKKILLLSAAFLVTISSTSTFMHLQTLDTLIAQLKLKTSRAEFVETPTLLQSIIEELHTIQGELQSLSCFTHTALQNIAESSQTFNTISEKISNLIPEKCISVNVTSKTKNSKKNTTLSRSLKILEKHHTALTKNIRNLDTVHKILEEALTELETIQQEIYNLAQTVKSLALSYHHQAHAIFAVALKLFKLTGIESDTGPYLCESDPYQPETLHE